MSRETLFEHLFSHACLLSLSIRHLVPQYASPDDAFLALLEDHGVKSFWKWDVAMPLIIHDRRYLVLKSVDEKKRVFRVFQERLIEREQEQERRRLSAQRDDFQVCRFSQMSGAIVATYES